MSTTGVVLSVDVERYGDTLAAPALTTDVVLQVEDVVDFADEDDFAAGPQWLTVGGSAPMQYVSVDDEADTVTLAAAIGTAYEAGEPVRMWDPTIGENGGEVISYLAWVELDEADENDQPIPVEVRHEQMVFFGIDNLAGLIGAHVAIEEDEDDPEAWHVIQVIGRRPVLDAGAVATPTIRLYLASDSAAIPDGVDTTLTGWTRAPYSFGFGPWSPSVGGRVRIDTTGIYRLEAFAPWQGSTSGRRTIIVERMDFTGALYEMRRITASPASDGQITSFIAETYRMVSGEWLTIKVFQNSGAGLVVRGAADQSRAAFKLTWVAPS